MASERRSKERRHAMEALTRSAMSGRATTAELPSAHPESVRDAGGQRKSNYGSDTALANSTCGVAASIGDRLTCSSTAAILLADRVLALDTTGW
jgi:hypothetical protein